MTTDLSTLDSSTQIAYFNNSVSDYYNALMKVAEALDDSVTASELDVISHSWLGGKLDFNDLDKQLLVKHLSASKQAIDKLIAVLCNAGSQVQSHELTDPQK